MAVLFPAVKTKIRPALEAEKQMYCKQLNLRRLMVVFNSRRSEGLELHSQI
jgi:hypothetical protein